MNTVTHLSLYGHLDDARKLLDVVHAFPVPEDTPCSPVYEVLETVGAQFSPNGVHRFSIPCHENRITPASIQ